MFLTYMRSHAPAHYRGSLLDAHSVLLLINREVASGALLRAMVHSWDASTLEQINLRSSYVPLPSIFWCQQRWLLDTVRLFPMGSSLLRPHESPPIILSNIGVPNQHFTEWSHSIRCIAPLLTGDIGLLYECHSICRPFGLDMTR